MSNKGSRQKIGNVPNRLGRKQKAEGEFLASLRADFDSLDFDHQQAFLVEENGTNRLRTDTLLNASKSYDSYRKQWVEWAVNDKPFEGLLLWRPGSGDVQKKLVLEVLQLVLLRGDEEDKDKALYLLMLWGGVSSEHADGEGEELPTLEAILFEFLNSSASLKLKAKVMKYIACLGGYFGPSRPKVYETYWLKVAQIVNKYVDDMLQDEGLEEAEESYLNTCINVTASLLPFMSAKLLSENLQEFVESLTLAFEVANNRLVIAEAIASVMDVIERTKIQLDLTPGEWRTAVLKEAESNKDWKALASVMDEYNWEIEVPFFRVTKVLMTGSIMRKKNQIKAERNVLSHPPSHWVELQWFKIVKDCYGKTFNICFGNEEGCTYDYETKLNTFRPCQRVLEILEQHNHVLYNDKRLVLEDPLLLDVNDEEVTSERKSDAWKHRETTGRSLAVDDKGKISWKK